MTIQTTTKRAGGFTIVAVLGALSLSACNLEVLNPGSILDEDLTTRDLMPILVSGVSAEFNDIADGYAFTGARLTDDLAGYRELFQHRQVSAWSL